MPQPEVFNWGGIISAEAPGIEFWRWSKSAAVSADKLLEGAIESVERELTLRGESYPDPESYGEAQYFLVEEPASFARSALFCQLAGSFEFALFSLCGDAATAINSATVQPRFTSEVVLNRLRCLREMTGVDFPGNSAEVFVLTRLRNVFAHADGIPGMLSESDRRSIDIWLGEHTELADATGHAIRLKAGFVRYCIEKYNVKLNEISGAIVEKMRVRESMSPRG